MLFKSTSSNQLITLIQNGAVGILPTDTIYGLVGQALNKKSVERIYKIKGRRPDKPLIILIAKIADLKLFGADIDDKTRKILNKLWPGQVSIILPCPKQKFAYLHRGTRTLAFRLPDDRELISLIEKAGSLVAPSANPEGLTPAITISQAKKYFQEEVDFYVDAGEIQQKTSTLISVEKGAIKILRPGAVKINV